jgi:hypothetical protein
MAEKLFLPQSHVKVLTDTAEQASSVRMFRTARGRPLQRGADFSGNSARPDDDDLEIVCAAARHECSFRLVMHANLKTRYAWEKE